MTAPETHAKIETYLQNIREEGKEIQKKEDEAGVW
jgi:hypothetical protein